jgi:aminopeptidase N
MDKSTSLKAAFPNLWHEYLDYKFSGLRIDCTSQTHPITCLVERCDKAMANFDGISYGKGAAFLKQIYHAIGHETMSKGL